MIRCSVCVGIAQGGLGNNDVRGLRWVVEGLDRGGGVVGGSCGRHNSSVFYYERSVRVVVEKARGAIWSASKSGRKSTSRNPLKLDMSMFGAPEDISLSDWQDAWINRLEIIKKTSEKDIYKYFKAHKKYVSQQEDFAKEFEAYKRFDIYFCRHYSNTRFKMNPQQYSAKVLEFKIKFPSSSFVTKPLRNLSVTLFLSTRRLVSNRTTKTKVAAPFRRALIQASKRVSASSAVGFGIEAATAPSTKKGVVIACWKNACVIVISSGAEPCFLPSANPRPLLLRVQIQGPYTLVSD
jgi:hypothetical protein